MATTGIRDVWPANLTGPVTVNPVAVLRRQAEALGEKTHNFVIGEVETTPVASGTMFEHSFVLVAPFLRFRFPLLRVTHRIQPYPATVAETDLTKPIDAKFWNTTAQDEKELLTALEEFFATDRVVSLVRSLITQSNDYAPEDDN